ncbi:YceD family protein [Chachezhania antarctica]|uniref:YceD family protein n=1 Tax=Chachezhania antarctica TaxID=2340860 RepID=UPI000EAC8670|nr:YceD family protein [Chachezhania antarctica]|tara:strand:- start:4497 stop:5033 length:537 start_codon:yes stop_codon:yes gene_type:complete
MPQTTALRVADLPQRKATSFALKPDAAECAALASELGLDGLSKLRFTGQVAPNGSRDWQLDGELGATVVQPCVVTLEPVTTRIDIEVTRLYSADFVEPDAEEVELTEDETLEPLREVIDPAVVMAEALALALPLYPRKDGASLGEAVFAAPGVDPLRDTDLKPFAGLKDLRDKLSGDE